MVCQYCGLESDGPTNHGSPEGCIAALERERARLRRIVDTADMAGGRRGQRHRPRADAVRDRAGRPLPADRPLNGER